MSDAFPGLKLVLQTDSYDYDWSVFSVFKEKATGYYYWIGESGCSCDSPLENASKADLTRGTKQELIRAFSRWADVELAGFDKDRTRHLKKLSRLS